jgi:hypothetical protein
MSTIIEQTPVTLPTVIYDRDHLRITAKVLVSNDPVDAAKFIIQAPPIAIVGPYNGGPSSLFTVLWEFEGVGEASFDSYQIQIRAPQIPTTGVHFETSLLEGSGGPPRRLELPMEIDGDVGLSSFNYEISVNSGQNPGPQPRFGTTHDPTIIVTPDPIGG